MTIPSLNDAAKRIDMRSTRSRQRKLGPSSIGTCRRRAGYEFHATTPMNPEAQTSLAAIFGTWIHKGALDALAREYGALIELVVEDDLLRGHIDALHLPARVLEQLPAKYRRVAPIVDDPIVDDLKTKRDSRAIDYVRIKGPKRSELFQVHIYADQLRQGNVKPLKRQAAIAELGPIEVETVVLRYVARDGSGAEYLYKQPYDPEITAEAMSWVKQVKESASPEDLPRDQDGPELSIVCDNCPFLLNCWGEEVGGVARQSQLVVTDNDVVNALEEYDTQSAIAREAEARKKFARATLDASDHAVYVDEAGDRAFKLGWSGGNPQDPKPDFDKILKILAEAEVDIPMKAGGRTARTMRVTPYEAPEEEKKACPKFIGQDDLEDPDSVPEDDRVPCVLAKRHSGACAPARVIKASA